MPPVVVVMSVPVRVRVVIVRVTRIIAVIRPVVAVAWTIITVIPRNTEPKTQMYSGLSWSGRPRDQTERYERE
jgi:hypothetical protein